MISSGKIKDVRLKVCMTQEEFARVLGCHTQTVSKWERGEAKPEEFQEALIEAFSYCSPHFAMKAKQALVSQGLAAALLELMAPYEFERKRREMMDL